MGDWAPDDLWQQERDMWGVPPDDDEEPAMRIYGLAEIAQELGENVNTVRAWLYRGKLPAPTEKLKGGHVWQGEEIESWIIDQKGETR